MSTRTKSISQTMREFSESGFYDAMYGPEREYEAKRRKERLDAWNAKPSLTPEQKERYGDFLETLGEFIEYLTDHTEWDIQRDVSPCSCCEEIERYYGEHNEKLFAEFLRWKESLE